MNEKPDSNDGEVNKDAKSQSEYKMQMRFGWDQLIEELIQEGKDKGAFDNLKGHGKPLKLNNNVYEGESELANTLLKDNNLKPAWIANRLSIQEKIESLRNEIGRVRMRHVQAVRLTNDFVHEQALTNSWRRVCARWELDINKLNKEIDDFNLRRPSGSLEIYKLSLDDELGDSQEII